ncbi:hypothetical protein [Pseudomonas lactis]|uniref:hypothetical protein n=1 Tax=Pseudomonas lactis TaxID=1615674 RepID=UPI003F80EBCB
MKLSRRSLLKASSAIVLCSSIPSVYASASEPDIENDKINALYKRKSILLDAKIKNSKAPTVTFLGDSNTHGVGSNDIYRNGYVNIVKRLANFDHGSFNYGFTPLMSTGVGEYFSQDIHEISFLREGGKKNSWISCEGEKGGHTPQGLSFVSFESGNIIATTIPTFQRKVKIWYVAGIDHGSFVVKINGKSVTVVNTNENEFNPLSSITVDLYDGHYEKEGLPFPTLTPGLCRVECVTDSGKKVEICGFSYINSDNQLTVNNFSNSGRRLRWMDDLAIKKLVESTDVLFMALSYNDAFDNSNDSQYFEQYKNRISSLIKYSKEFNVSVFVLDFIWDELPNNITRSELRRLALESGGTYIPFPEIFSPDGISPSWRYRMNEAKMFFEPAHLNIYGHECVSNIVCSYMGLGAATKEFALSSCDWWYPLKLLSTGVGNAGSNSDEVTAVRNIAKGVSVLRLGVTGITSSIDRDICQEWPSRSGVSGSGISTHPLESTPSGDGQGIVRVTPAGSITAFPSRKNAKSTHSIFATFPSN